MSASLLNTTMIDVEKLKQIQQQSLRILKVLDELCQSLDLKYFVVSGTLLGAIRHKGFIPWDDDIDVVMLREDYERFLREAPSYIQDRYFIQDFRSDPHFPFGFARILDLDSFKVGRQLTKFKDGLVVDIFPLDTAPKTKIFQKINRAAIMAIQGLSKAKVPIDLTSYQRPLDRVLIWLGSKLGHLVSTRNLMGIQRVIAMSNSSRNSRCLVGYSFPFNYTNVLLSEEAFQESIPLEFEDMMVSAPIGWEEQLTKFFGNYLELPPPEMRVPLHGYQDIEFKEHD